MAVADPFEQSLVGAVLSRRFRLMHELGRGGMGTVYAAAPLDGGPAVAIKILHPAYIDEPQVLTRFLEEGRTCIRLVHRNILRMHEVLTAEDGSPYLVMDLLDGVPLSAYTKNGGRIAVGHAVPILQGILAGLAAAHEEGVVHRDLKPGNVFLARDEAGLFVVKLLDFGIAKVMDAAGGMGNRTRTGMLLGTPAYMSPEQITSAKDVDARADLWSAGVMFYEMLTGRTAFPAPTEYARLSAVLQSQPEPIEKVDPQLAYLAGFVSRALEKNRDKRFPSASVMAQAIVAAATMKEPTSRLSMVPLSRLPDRPWLAGNAPSNATTTPAPVGMHLSRDRAREAGLGEGGPPTAPAMVAAPVADDAATRFDTPVQTPGGTLASLTPSSPPGPPTPKPEERVVVVTDPNSGTLSSVERRIPKRRGVAMWLVAVLVMTSLGIGIIVGFALGRM